MEPKFKKDDWCFFRFELVQVQETEDDRITRVSDGYFSSSGTDLSRLCFPLTLEIKRISHRVHSHYSDFREIKVGNLNLPDIYNNMVERWVALCNTNGNDVERGKLYESLQDFSTKLFQAIYHISDSHIDGIRLLRQ